MAGKTTGIVALCATILLLQAQSVCAVTFAIPSKTGAAGYTYAPLDPAPVGISFEFFTFPSYMTNVTATHQCLANWKNLSGTWPPIRIGGTTQDRASFGAASEAYVTYSVANPADAPMSLTFGKRFMTLAGGYNGSVVVGLNRGKDNIENTIAAAKVAVTEIPNLLAIELGNEPEYYPKDGQPIARGTWNPAVDAASQISWITRLGSAVGRPNIIQAGNWNQAPPEWGAAQMMARETPQARQYIRHYAHHNYPGGSVQKLQSHAQTVSNVRGLFDADVAAVRRSGREYVLGETNSVSGGGAANVSPTFGAALWTMDYVLQATSRNISRTYFHHGTIGNCQYCFWGRYSMGAPYYGATAAVALLGGGARHLAALDNGNSAFAGYVTFDSEGRPLRVLLYNSEYWTGSGSGARRVEGFTLTGLPGGLERVRAKRLTSPGGAMDRVDRGGEITFGGQKFQDGTCVLQGEDRVEVVSVVEARVTLEVKATEALLVYLQ